MPNRMLRDWTNSDKVNELSVHAEVFFTRLIMKVDDHGCFWADVKRLKGNLFILKSDSIRDADISRWMAECQKAGLIVIYKSDGKEYLQISDFNQRLRTKTSKFPLPTLDGQMTDTCQTDDGLKRREVEEEIEEEEKANAQNAFVVYNAETEILKNPIEFEKICMKSGFDISLAREILRKYHLYLEEKEQYPKGRKSIFSGFERWLLNEKKFKNGSHKQTSKSTGAEQLLDSLKADIAAGAGNYQG